MLKSLYTSTKSPGVFSTSSRGYWINSWDALFIHRLDGANTMSKVFLDGSQVTMGEFTFNGDSVDLDNAPELGDMVILTNSRGHTQLDTLAFTPDLQKPFVTGLVSPALSRGLFLRDGAGVMKYYQPFGKGYKRYDSLTGALEDTVTVYLSGLNVDRAILWVNNQVVLFPLSTGEIFLFDVGTETIVLESFIEPAKLVFMDNTHQNIVSIRDSDKVVQLWALEVEPFSMSALSGTPGTYTRYHTEELSVTVLGDGGEAAAGVSVEWTVEILGGPGGAVNDDEVNNDEINAGSPSFPAKGKITPNVSITNALGIATATYCPPGLDWVSGDQETITALVRT